MPLQMDPSMSTSLPQVSSCATFVELAAPRPGEIRAGASRAVSFAIAAARRRRFGNGSDMAPAARKRDREAKYHCDKPQRRPKIIIGFRSAPVVSKGGSADN
jgi:hypothetical protein